MSVMTIEHARSEEMTGPVRRRCEILTSNLDLFLLVASSPIACYLKASQSSYQFSRTPPLQHNLLCSHQCVMRQK